MKRTPLKRGPGPKRKTPLKAAGRIKPKAPRYPGPEEKRARKKWEKKQRLCHICFARAGRETHHIALRSMAPGRFERPCNWLWVCGQCHHWLHNTGGNRHAYLLHLKALRDPESSGVNEWLNMVRRPPSYLLSRAAQ